jgi:hypothetical protein
VDFLNLTFAQVAMTFGAIAAFSIALYLLDRTRRRQVVATLRFWVVPGQPAPVSRNRRIQQPLSLLMQLLGMLLLLLALAEFEIGGSIGKRHDHVLVLDTSAWMAATLPNRADTSLMDEARAGALAWLRAVPSNDRVLIVRAAGLATPVTAWESDHRKAARAILESQPGSTALNLSLNLEFAHEMQQRNGGSAGEIVYIGPARISAREAAGADLPQLASLRVIRIEDGAIENAGIRSVGAHRSDSNPDAWDVLVHVRNYGARPHVSTVTLNFGSAPQGSQQVLLQAGEEREISFPVRTNAAGVIEARLYPKDSFSADNFAALEIPEQRGLHVIVYSDDPEAIRPALSSDPRVHAEFRKTAQFTAANDGLVILDRFQPPARPEGNTLWIDPPGAHPPVPIRERVEHPEGLRWVPDQPLTQGLRARNAEIASASVFEAGADTIRVAEIEKGPVIVARPGMVVIGFNPFAGAMRYELTTPLLLANVLRWMQPAAFRDLDVATQSAGAVSAPISAAAKREDIQVMTEDGRNLPFNIRDRAVQFFAGEPARVRVIAANNERVYSLSLPEMWDTRWTEPSTALRGIPPLRQAIRRALLLWPWLALLGAGLLIFEWLLYGAPGTSRLRVIRGTA